MSYVELLRHKMPALLLGLFMVVFLSSCVTVKCDDCDKGDMACSNVEPAKDQDGKVIPHWPCRKTPNGSGGYYCAAGYEDKVGCNSCPTCKCDTVGSGSSQNCVCAP